MTQNELSKVMELTGEYYKSSERAAQFRFARRNLSDYITSLPLTKNEKEQVRNIADMFFNKSEEQSNLARDAMRKLSEFSVEIVKEYKE